ncbi:MAG: hypothetical protein ACI8SC_002392, partial [Colwellia sp.]
KVTLYTIDNKNVVIYPFHLNRHDSAGIRNAFRQGID